MPHTSRHPALYVRTTLSSQNQPIGALRRRHVCNWKAPIVNEVVLLRISLGTQALEFERR